MRMSTAQMAITRNNDLRRRAAVLGVDVPRKCPNRNFVKMRRLRRWGTDHLQRGQLSASERKLKLHAGRLALLQ